MDSSNLVTSPTKAKKSRAKLLELNPNSPFVESIKNLEKKEIQYLREKVLIKLTQGATERRQATELIVDFIKRNNKIYTIRDDNSTEMWIYHDGIYIPQGKSYIKEVTRAILKEVYTSNLSNEIINKIEPDTFIDSRNFFFGNQDSKWFKEEIVVKNGILNIVDKTLRPFTPDKIFFNKLPLNYNPKSTCPNILKFFEGILENYGDLVAMLELFGYLLYKENKLECAFIFVGNGRNGKSKTIEIMEKFLGEDNKVAIPLQKLESDNWAMAELSNVMANLCGDIDKKALCGSATIKRILGRDSINASRKYLPDIKFKSYSKQIFSANELPYVPDDSEGFFSKWVKWNFPYTFKTKEELDIIKKDVSEDEFKYYKIKDPEIISKIITDEELSGLLNVAIESLIRLFKRGHFYNHISSDDVKEFWLKGSDNFKAFCMDCLKEKPDGKITKAELRQAYNDYLFKNNIKSRKAGDKWIKKLLDELYGAFDGRYGSEQITFWSGITFKEGCIDCIDCNGFSTYKGI